MLKRTPLYEAHLKIGAKLVPFAGWEMPVSYPAGIIAEHLAVRNSLGIFDIGHMGLIKLQTSNDKLQSNVILNFLQLITTNNAAKLEQNQCQYSILCNEAGGVIDDILLYRIEDCFMIIANASNADKVLAWLKMHAPKDLEVEFYPDRTTLSLQGPKALSVVAENFSAPLADLKRNRVLIKDEILFSRTGYTGEDGIEIILPANKVNMLWEKFIRQGIQPCGLGARDTLRLEAGLPLYGHEYDEETSPISAGYGWAVKFDKGNFIGRDALLKEKTEGTKRLLVGLEIDGRAIPRQGNLTFDAGSLKLIGCVTSGTFSPTFKKPIALAYLNAPANQPLLGSHVQVEIRSQRVPARVVDKSFYKRVK